MIIEPRDFVYWLQGFFEISGETEITDLQAQIIKDHLALVFKKETPNRQVPKEPSPFSCEDPNAIVPLTFVPMQPVITTCSSFDKEFSNTVVTTHDEINPEPFLGTQHDTMPLETIQEGLGLVVEKLYDIPIDGYVTEQVLYTGSPNVWRTPEDEPKGELK